MSDHGEQCDLPRPDARQRRDVIIYDAGCAVCRATARRLHRWDIRHRLAFLPLDDPEVRRRWPDLTHQELMKHVYLLTSDGQRLRGAQAVRVLARRVPALWPIAPALHMPGTMPLWRRLYDWFAEHRYLFGGRTRAHCRDEACEDRHRK